MTFKGKITSPETPDYNCIAWAVKDNFRFWWSKGFPPYFWPEGVKKEETLEAFVEAYAIFGYEVCEDESLELGFEKIAIYVDGEKKPKHAARQIDENVWTSKLGSSVDIEHPFVMQWTELLLEGENIDLSIYGKLGKILKKRLKEGA